MSSYIPGFTVSDGWARGLSPAQTVEHTNLRIDTVEKIYDDLDAQYDAHVKQTQSQGESPCVHFTSW